MCSCLQFCPSGLGGLPVFFPLGHAPCLGTVTLSIYVSGRTKEHASLRRISQEGTQVRQFRSSLSSLRRHFPPRSFQLWFRLMVSLCKLSNEFIKPGNRCFFFSCPKMEKKFVDILYKTNLPYFDSNFFFPSRYRVSLCSSRLS